MGGALRVPATSADTGPASDAAQPFPVLPALSGLLPGLRRGQVVAMDSAGALSLALLAGASSAGAWCAAVGVPDLGVLAAAELGVDLDRVVVVSDPGQRWAEVVAVLLGAVQVVLVRPAGKPTAAMTRRLAALARQHRSTLVVAGAWDGAQARLQVVASQWSGPDRGRGYLRSRRVHVEVSGRGAAARPRRAWLWLPGPDGRVAPAELTAVPGGQGGPATPHVAPRATPRATPRASRHVSDLAGVQPAPALAVAR